MRIVSCYGENGTFFCLAASGSHVGYTPASWLARIVYNGVSTLIPPYGSTSIVQGAYGRPTL